MSVYTQPVNVLLWSYSAIKTFTRLSCGYLVLVVRYLLFVWHIFYVSHLYSITKCGVVSRVILCNMCRKSQIVWRCGRVSNTHNATPRDPPRPPSTLSHIATLYHHVHNVPRCVLCVTLWLLFDEVWRGVTWCHVVCLVYVVYGVHVACEVCMFLHKVYRLSEPN